MEDLQLVPIQNVDAVALFVNGLRRKQKPRQRPSVPHGTRRTGNESARRCWQTFREMASIRWCP